MIPVEARLEPEEEAPPPEGVVPLPDTAAKPPDGRTPELPRAAATSPRTASLMAAISTPRGPEPDGKEGTTPGEAAERGNPAVGGPETGTGPGGVAAGGTIGGGTGTTPGVEAGVVERAGKEVGNLKAGGAETTMGEDRPAGTSKGGADEPPDGPAEDIKNREYRLETGRRSETLSRNCFNLK